ncbi:MAG: nitronate monooxygenase family protein [Chloroflexota bacterium]|nr:nitronate monooxygenase family protein [Chloroflexota bacterium]
MLRTALTETLGIEHPIVLAPMGSCTSAEFAAAASNAGGLGSIATLHRSRDSVLRDLHAIRDLTERPFAVNHVPQSLDEAAFEETLALKPAVISFALGDPGELIDRAKWAGAKTMLQVTTVAQAELGAERGVDVIVAQGGEAGGFGGSIGTMVLVPQVAQAVAPIPVVAAGGVFDGRGLAAALALGAAGANIGTRFIATEEAPASEEWKRAILAARSEDTVKAAVFNVLDPNPGEEGFGTVLRSLRTPFLDQWNDRIVDAVALRSDLIGRAEALHQSGRGHEVVMTAGQGAGAIAEIEPIGDLLRRIVAEAEDALRGASSFVAT